MFHVPPRNIKRSFSTLSKTLLAVSLAVPLSAFGEEDLGSVLGGAILNGIVEGLNEAANPNAKSPAPNANSPAYQLPDVSGNWQPGTKVECNWQGGGTYYPGVIRSISGSNLYIQYDDGGEEQTQAQLCRSPYGKPPAAAANKHPSSPQANYFAVGSYVLGHWNDGFWYPARVESINQNGYALAFDGGKTYSVAHKNVAPFNWRVGSGVQCNWQGSGTYYDAAIAAMRGNQLTVRYGNGSQENTVMARCRSGAVNKKRAKANREKQAKQMLRDSSRDVPSDPAEFLRAIERNLGQ